MSTARRNPAKAAALGAPVHPAGGRLFIRRPRRARRGEQQARTVRVAVVLSLFLVALAAGLLIGGHAVIDPLLRAAAEKRETHRMGGRCRFYDARRVAMPASVIRQQDCGAHRGRGRTLRAGTAERAFRRQGFRLERALTPAD